MSRMDEDGDGRAASQTPPRAGAGSSPVDAAVAAEWDLSAIPTPARSVLNGLSQRERVVLARNQPDWAASVAFVCEQPPDAVRAGLINMRAQLLVAEDVTAATDADDDAGCGPAAPDSSLSLRVMIDVAEAVLAAAEADASPPPPPPPRSPPSAGGGDDDRPVRVGGAGSGESSVGDSDGASGAAVPRETKALTSPAAAWNTSQDESTQDLVSSLDVPLQLAIAAAAEHRDAVAAPQDDAPQAAPSPIPASAPAPAAPADAGGVYISLRTPAADARTPAFDAARTSQLEERMQRYGMRPGERSYMLRELTDVWRFEREHAHELVTRGGEGAEAAGTGAAPLPVPLADLRNPFSGSVSPPRPVDAGSGEDDPPAAANHTGGGKSSPLLQAILLASPEGAAPLRGRGEQGAWTGGDDDDAGAGYDDDPAAPPPALAAGELSLTEQVVLHVRSRPQLRDRVLMLDAIDAPALLDELRAAGLVISAAQLRGVAEALQLPLARRYAR
jgi:hypothetical protein